MTTKTPSNRRKAVDIAELLAHVGYCSYNNLCASPSIRRSDLERSQIGVWTSKMRPSFSTALRSRSRTRARTTEKRRIICYGLLSGRLVVIGYTLRGATRHVFSMRKANDREKARLAPYFEV